MNRAEKAYESNGTTLLIYLDAKRVYFETIADYYETLAKLPGAFAELESALGVPLNNQ